jgi:SAM-dependent methyltransferase
MEKEHTTDDERNASSDSIFYRDSRKGMRLIVKARRAMFKLFINQIQPNSHSKIIDIGVSGEENDGANFLEQNYQWPSQITCAGIGDGLSLKSAHPEVSFINIEPNKPLPFPDNYFDISYSNAVIEHVGGPKERAFFISEHLRVAKQVFLTFPNRWFPVEHHTSLPLLHFSPYIFRKVLRGTRYHEWTDVKLLDFLDKESILSEWPTPIKPTVIHTGIQLSRFSSNVAVIFKK